MNGFTDAVRTRIANASCLVGGIDRGTCGVSLADAPHPRVIVDLDQTGSPLGGTQTKCDFLFFADPDLVVPIEIKDHGAPDITKAIRQLQAGAKAAQELASADLAITFRPVLVSRNLRRHKQLQLRGARVGFRKHQERVRRLVCGDPLTGALESA